MESAEIAVIGAGFAGAAAACFLARQGFTDLIVLDQEAAPGMHASGKNAAMVRQLIPDPAIATLAREGAAFILSQPAEWKTRAQFEPNGSLLLAEGEAFEALKRDAEGAQRNGVQTEILSPAECLAKSPWIEGGHFDGGAFCPSDGVVDIAGLLKAYLDEAERLGARIRFSSKVIDLKTENGRVSRIETTQGSYAVRTVVNAAGAWAGRIADMAGAQDIGLVPYRRHLFVSDWMEGIDPRWPFVWDISHEAYFRPEPPGLLLCACDEKAMAPQEPLEDPSAMEFLAEKMIGCFPKLMDVSISRHWAGLRTMAPDHRFVIGWDKKVEGFFWLAGMGGHGVTTSAAIGRLTADLIAGNRRDDAETFDPARFGNG